MPFPSAASSTSSRPAVAGGGASATPLNTAGQRHPGAARRVTHNPYATSPATTPRSTSTCQQQRRASQESAAGMAMARSASSNHDTSFNSSVVSVDSACVTPRLHAAAPPAAASDHKSVVACSMIEEEAQHLGPWGNAADGYAFYDEPATFYDAPATFYDAPATFYDAPVTFDDAPAAPAPAPTLHFELIGHVSFVAFETEVQTDVDYACSLYAGHGAATSVSAACSAADSDDDNGRDPWQRLFFGQLPYHDDAKFHFLIRACCDPSTVVKDVERITKRCKTGSARISTGCMHASVRASQLAGLLESIHKRVLFDASGLWVARNAYEKEYLDAYVASLKAQPNRRLADFPNDSVAVEVATSTFTNIATSHNSTIGAPIARPHPHHRPRAAHYYAPAHGGHTPRSPTAFASHYASSACPHPGGVQRASAHFAAAAPSHARGW